MVLGGGAAIFAHGEANIGLREGTGVAQALASDTNHGSTASKGAYKHVFKFRGSSVDKRKLGLDLLESSLALLVVENEGLTTSLSFILSFAHHLLEVGKKLIRVDANAILVDVVEAELLGACDDGLSVVTGDDSNIGLGVIKLEDGVIDVLSEAVQKADGGDQGEIALNSGAGLLILEPVVGFEHVLEGGGIKISVGDSDGFEASAFSIWLLIRSEDDFIDDSAREIVLSIVSGTSEAGLLIVHIEFGTAHGDNGFGGTLDDDASGIGSILECVSDSHDLALGAEGNPELECNLLRLALDKFLLDVDTFGEEEVE